MSALQDMRWRKVRWPLREAPTTWRGGSWRECLEIEFSLHGRRLVAEAAPLPGLHRESIQECLHHLVPAVTRLLELPISGETDQDSLPAALRLADRDLLWAGLPPSLRFALESALWRDVFAADLTVIRPVCRLLSGQPGQWAAALEPDASCCKVKLGRAGLDEELAGLDELRRTHGSRLEIRLDANCRWNSTTLERACTSLPALAPAWIEDPLGLPGELAVWLAGWRKGRDWPLAQDLGEHEELLRHPALAACILKPQLLGIGRCLEQIARLPSGVRPVLSSCFESPRARDVMHHLAATLCPATLPGLDTHRFFADEAPVMEEWHPCPA